MPFYPCASRVPSLRLVKKSPIISPLEIDSLSLKIALFTSWQRLVEELLMSTNVSPFLPKCYQRI